MKDFVDPPFVIEKVDYATGNTKFADFDSETTMDENMTPETTPRSVRILLPFRSNWLRRVEVEHGSVRKTKR